MVSSRKKKNLQKRQLSQLDETLSNFVIGNNIDATVVQNETQEPQKNGPFNTSERTIGGENAAGQNQVGSNNIISKLGKQLTTLL